MVWAETSRRPILLLLRVWAEVGICIPESYFSPPTVDPLAIKAPTYTWTNLPCGGPGLVAIRRGFAMILHMHDFLFSASGLYTEL